MDDERSDETGGFGPGAELLGHDLELSWLLNQAEEGGSLLPTTERGNQRSGGADMELGPEGFVTSEALAGRHVQDDLSKYTSMQVGVDVGPGEGFIPVICWIDPHSALGTCGKGEEFLRIDETTKGWRFEITMSPDSHPQLWAAASMSEVVVTSYDNFQAGQAGATAVPLDDWVGYRVDAYYYTR